MTTFVIDFETNGLNPFHDSVIEIAIKVFGSDKSFECLLRPQNKRVLSDKITEITGITNQILKEKGLKYKEAYTKMISFIEENTTEGEPFYLIAHNGVAFDFLFFKKILRDMGTKLDDVKYIDSIFFSKYVHPDQWSHSMKSLCKLYAITNTQEHRAMGDIMALEELVVKMMEKDGITDPIDIYAKVEFL